MLGHSDGWIDRDGQVSEQNGQTDRERDEQMIGWTDR